MSEPKEGKDGEEDKSAEVVRPIQVSFKLTIAPLERQQEKRNVCWTCRKKVGLLGFECRCSYVFCSTHRYSDAHNCDFDHKLLNQ